MSSYSSKVEMSTFMPIYCWKAMHLEMFHCSCFFSSLQQLFHCQQLHFIFIHFFKIWGEWLDTHISAVHQTVTISMSLSQYVCVTALICAKSTMCLLGSSCWCWPYRELALDVIRSWWTSLWYNSGLPKKVQMTFRGGFMRLKKLEEQ